MQVITKKFKGFPFAHRQHTHEGHCSLIHGHNWDFEITLSATELDENNFVYDFGKLKWFREWLKGKFDHTLVLPKDDPLIKSEDIKKFSKLIVLESASAEHIAKYVFEFLETRLATEAGDRVRVEGVTVYEDDFNSATFYNEH